MELGHRTLGRFLCGVSVGRTVDLAAVATCIAWIIYFIVTTTSGFNWLTTWHNEQRAVQVVLLAVTALVAPLCVRHLPSSNRLSRLSIATMSFFALGLASASAAASPTHSLAEIALLVALIGLVVVAWYTASRVPTRAISWAFLGLGTAHVTGVVTRYLTAISLSKPIGMDVLLLGYANPRFPSALYALLIPFLAYAAGATDERRSIRAVAFAVLCALWTVNLALATRAIFFAYVVAAPIFVVWVGTRKARPILWTVAVSFFLGLLLYWVMFDLVPTWAGLSTADLARDQAALSDSSGRLSLWKSATALIVANPILGVGPMHFAATSHQSGAHPHNSILQLASEWGVPATLALVYVLWGGFQSSARAIRRSDSDATCTGATAFFALIVASTYSLVDGNYLMPVSQSAIAISMGVLLAGTFPCKSTSEQSLQGSPWPSRLVGAGIAASGIYLLAYAVATIESGTPASGSYSLPRFWEQGLIARPAANGLR